MRDFEYLRMLFIGSLSPVLGYFTPTTGFLLSLVVMFGFNIWAGMRADGVAIKHCRNFKFSKFRHALGELVLYLVIIELVFSVMKLCGDEGAAVIVIKSLTYVFMYVYLQNSFRNLVSAYPKSKALWMIYYIIRLEFKRALPGHIAEIVENYEKDHPEEGKL